MTMLLLVLQLVTTTTTLPTDSPGYCVMERIKAWAQAHPGQDLTPEDWKFVYFQCQPR